MTNRRSKTKAGVDQQQRRKNRTKSRVRAKVEWPFRILKRVFQYNRVRYRGLKKNHAWLLAAFALVNLYQHRKRLAPVGRSAPKAATGLRRHPKNHRKPPFSLSLAVRRKKFRLANSLIFSRLKCDG